MAFWIITCALALIVAALLGMALLRPVRGAQSAGDFDVRVYRDQLAEVDRDLARGVLSEADASRVRTEVSRRILAADAAITAQTGGINGPTKPMVIAIALVLVAGSFGLYRGVGSTYGLGAPGYGDLALADRIKAAETTRATRPNQAEAEAALPDLAPTTTYDSTYLDLVEKLRQTVADRPADIQGHTLLAQSEANLGNFAASHHALRVVIDLKGSAVTATDLTDYADMLILAAGGYISPEAERVLSAVLARAPSNGTARYYMGLMMLQTGRPDVAFRVWDQLLRAGPADAVWIAPILEQIEETAARAGVRYDIPAVGSGVPTRGPSSDDIEAAGQMSGTERMEMIEGMVAGLSTRLGANGGLPEEWAQLISALGVLGRRDEAATAYNTAVDVYGDAPAAMDQITQAAQRAGVAE